MKLAPRMIQSMIILQLPLWELNQYIEQELVDNALLERSSERSPAQRKTPELGIKRNHDGKCIVELLGEYIPKLRINDDHLRQLQSLQNDELKENMRKKVESAEWLIEAIDLRYETMKRVAQAIVDQQSEFFDKGTGQISKLKMLAIADVVDVHVTTVSRTVDSKWIETPLGIMQLKSFFLGRVVD